MNKGKALVTEGKTLVASVDKPIKKILALRAKQISQVLVALARKTLENKGKALVTKRECLGDQRKGLGD